MAEDYVRTTELAEVEAALAQALAKFPVLTPCGLINRPGSFDPVGIAEAIRFLREISPAKKAAVHSYWAKHVAEAWAGRYLSNGELLVGAAYLGIGLEPIDGTPNALLAVSLSEMDTLHKRYVHPLDRAETVRKKSTERILSLLAERWPKCFVLDEKRRRPLAVGIRGIILAALGDAISESELALALAAYTNNVHYQKQLKAEAARISLDGRSVGIVTTEQAAWAGTLPPKSRGGDDLAALKAAAAARARRETNGSGE